MAEKTIDIASPILSRNERLADQLRQRFKETNTYVINVLSSPGSGKTTTILGTNERLRDKAGLRCAVIEGDIASDVDAITMKEAGMPAIQINTGGLCHLEGNMIMEAVDAFDQAVGLQNIDVIFIENVGNLVCPVDFDLGENLSIMILSVPEATTSPSSTRASSSTPARSCSIRSTWPRLSILTWIGILGHSMTSIRRRRGLP